MNVAKVKGSHREEAAARKPRMCSLEYHPLGSPAQTEKKTPDDPRERR